MRLFISSTFRDLRPEREAVRDVLNRRARVTPWGMELFASSPEKPLKVCLEWLHMSDAVVLVIGFFAGSLIPESPELTYTCAEFELAQQLGRPVFAFFKTEGGVPLNKETDPEKKKALDDFKSAVSSNGITPAYSDSTVLGDQHSQHANALAAVSADTPLVTVVGGRLIARGDTPPALLTNEDEFRRQVFDRFSAEYEELLPAGTVNCRKLLNLVAAVGPLAPTANSFLEPAAEIMRIGQDEIISAFDVLEKHGLLLRGGRLIRIVPDLLSDFLLEGAGITGAGESTRISDLVFRKFQPDYLSNILRNLGELDWPITQRNPDQGARLLDAASTLRSQNAENSRAKVQNVGGDSSLVLHVLPSGNGRADGAV